MSLFDNDIILPGVVTEIISDYSSGYDTSLFGTTEEVLVMGTAFNGKVGKAVPIYSPEHAEYIFGKNYDSTTRQEATLVSGIQDAWDRGCRTIYACRISGKELYKDYQLSADTNLKLRVAGIFPSNSNKNISLVYNDDAYEMSATVYKPAERATIAEKKKGIVEDSESIISNYIDLKGSGLSRDNELTELITAVNGYLYNNVLRLSIVDENGNDVTLSSVEAKGLKIGDMFPGLYTVGRNANAATVVADTQLSIVFDEKPYEGYDKVFYKKLSLNTNVAQDLPLYSKDHDLNEILGISSLEEYSFLTVASEIDKYFLKDNIDYEEVDLSAFDIYKKLGSGFAINASISVEEKMVDGVKKIKTKVKEVTDKAKKKTEIPDGIYSTLENVPSKYRVLNCAYAEQDIKGSLPKPNDFKFAKKGSIKLLNDSIEIISKINSKDLSEPKTYSISFETLGLPEETELENVKENLYTAKTIREVTAIDFADIATIKKSFDEGSLFLVKGVTSADFDGTQDLLYTYSNGKLISLHSFDTANGKDLLKNSLYLADNKVYICNKEVVNKGNPNLKFTSLKEIAKTDIDNKGYAIVSINNGLFQIVKVADTEVKGPDGTTSNVLTATVLGSIDQVLKEDEDKILVSISNTYGKNVIVIKSNQFDFLTIDEVVDKLNEDKDFSQLFEIKVVDILKAQECIDDIKDLDTANLKGDLINKVLAYDTTLLIPFRTDDNFARHLAQHCTYTSLKTAPTHGMIGTKLLLDTSIDSINNRVKELVSINMESSLVAKKANGANMLDKNNMPYPIGRKISIVTGQYAITTNSNYTTLSNGAAGYAGMVSCLPLDQSSTCQSITIPDLSYEFTNYQLGLLTSAGFITIKKSYTKGWVITDGITMAPADSVYRRLSASRIADYIEELLRSASEPYIGKQNNLSNQNSLRSAIKSILDTIKNTLIEEYDFKLVLDKNDTKMGIINIDYAIVPIYEIKEIKHNITITE